MVRFLTYIFLANQTQTSLFIFDYCLSLYDYLLQFLFNFSALVVHAKLLIFHV